MPESPTNPRALPLRLVARGSFALVLVTFLDEIHSGIPSLASPELQTGFATSLGQAAGWTLAAMGVLSLVLEPPVFLLADRHPRRPFVVGALLACAGTAFLASAAPTFGWLLAALVLFGPASGWACGTAQATLMDANPDARERWMLRWGLSGELGDLAVPIGLSLLAAWGFGWRVAFASVGVLWLVQALWIATRPFPEPAERLAPDPELGLFAALKRAAAERALWPWLGAMLLCDLMDETLTAFGALRVRDALGAGVHERSAIFGAGLVGGILGLLLAERLSERVAPGRLLAASALGAGIAYAVWLGATTVPLSIASFAVVGFFASMHYPLVAAQAYRQLPGASGALNALSVVTQALWLPVPILLGWIADEAGLFVACCLIGAQPLGLLAIAWATRERSPQAANR